MEESVPILAPLPTTHIAALSGLLPGRTPPERVYQPPCQFPGGRAEDKSLYFTTWL